MNGLNHFARATTALLLLGGALACDEKKKDDAPAPPAKVDAEAVKVPDAPVAAAPPRKIEEITVTSSVPEAVLAFGRGRDHSERGRVDAALAELKKAVELDKRFALAIAYLGFFTANEEGNDMLDHAVSLAEGLPPAEKLLIEHLRSWRHGDTVAMGAQRKQLEELAPTDWRVRLLSGMIAADEHQWAPAAKSMQQAIELNPNAVPAYIMLGTALLNQGKLDEAVATLTEATKREPEESSAFDALGEAQLRVGQFEAAEGTFQKAAELSKGAAASLLGVAQARFLKGDFEGGRKALADVQSGAAADPAAKVAAATVAVWSLVAEHKGPEALKAVAALEKLAKGSRHGEGYAMAQVLGAVALYDQAKYAQAADAASDAIDRVGKAKLQGEPLARLYRTALIWRLMSEVRGGKLKDAEKTFIGVQKAASLIISTESTSTRTHAAGLISKAKGDTQIAMQQLMECAEEDSFCRVDLAAVQAAAGDVEAATKTRDAVVKANRRDGPYLYARALANALNVAAPAPK